MLVGNDKSKIARNEVSLSDQAYHRVREGILRGRFGLGAVLSRRKLADEFAISLLPVSEALQKLESEGLVESLPRVGTRVRTPTEEEVRGRYVVREALEAESAKRCSMNCSFRERLELRRMAGQLDTLYARSSDPKSDSDFLYVVQQQHLNLHMRIAEFARCLQLKEAIERNHVLIYNWFFDISTPCRAMPPSFHSELMEKVTGDDPRAADEAMRLHVRVGLNSVLEKLTKAGATSDWRLKSEERD